MKIILKGRGEGKTMQLIHAHANHQGSVMVCSSVREAKRVQEMAYQLGYTISLPTTHFELINGKLRGLKLSALYIDNVKMLLALIVPGIRIAAITADVED